jgi:hypothetical protein
VTFGSGELGSEMSTFEVDDVSDDIRSSVSNGFSSSKASMVAPGGGYIAQDAENDMCLGCCVVTVWLFENSTGKFGKNYTINTHVD